MVDINQEIWRWYHNISECYYHIQITIKYRKALLNKKIEGSIVESLRGFKERYAIEISTIGFDQNHVHILCRFLPKYSGGQVIKIIKSISGKRVFEAAPEVKKELWGGENSGQMVTISQRLVGKETKKLSKSISRNREEKKTLSRSGCLNFDFDALRSLPQGSSLL